MRKTMKTLLSVVLSVALVFSMMPVSALAANEPEKVLGYVNEKTEVLDDLPESEELFRGYVNKKMQEEINGGISPFGIMAGSRLEDGTLIKTAYNVLRNGFEKVAKGQQASTVFEVPWDVVVTRDELGSDLIVNGNITEAAQNKMGEKIATNLQIERLMTAILADCPYDLYWFDKTKGFECKYVIKSYDQLIKVDNLSFEFSVSSAYMGSNENTVDTSKTGATTKAIANAQNIVDKYAGKSDDEKLALYKEEICNLVSYNFDVIGDSKVTPYGDPWQLIYVFDNDPNTNVVCEGYSKAFQYLCDLSNFKENIICFSVGGDMMTPDGSSGPHMWNIIQKGEKNYLVDITNCDENTVGYPNKLYMVSADSSEKNHRTHIVNNIKYVYDECENNINCDGYLCICKETQVHVHQMEKIQAKASTCTVNGNNEYYHCIKCNNYYKDQAGRNKTTVSAEKLPLKAHVSSGWALSNYSTLSANGYKYTKCTACGKRLSSQKIPYISSVKLSTTSYTYSGKTKTPSVKIKDASGKTLVNKVDYTVSYAKSRKNVGKYKVTITFKGNYRGTKSLYFKINPKGTSLSKIKSYKKSFKAYWKKQTKQITGYQVRYSTSSKMKSPKTTTVKGYKVTYKTVKKLKAKKNYYVQVRTYKKTFSGTFYSGWSKAKKVKTR